MPAAAVASERDRHIFARLLDGMSIRDIAEAEGLTTRRVQQIVAKELTKRDMNPAREYQMLQIARLERALDLLGAQIDAGKASAASAFVRVMEMLNRLASEQLYLNDSVFLDKREIPAMEERLERLSIAREVLAERHAKRNGEQAVERVENREIGAFRGSGISMG